ncbi:MAG TPA: zinc-binding alcohol dehydrogenase family protein [Anaeromyxobacter sp.]|nr:zinc-binding alcohol dehydrogenase family protein [Anaeromyxobacter sp.]
MRAIIMDAPGQVRVGDWEDRRPGPGEVLVASRAVGVCAGDLYIYQGKNPYVRFPQVAGHEIAGVVEEVGPGVSGLAPGTKVVVEPFLGCGQCYPCRVGKSNCCANLRIIGVTQPGGFGERVLAPAEKIHRVPESLSLADASFVEPVAIGVQACRRGAIAAGEYVLVLGCGPIGLAVIEVARARGARVVATDVALARMETAAKLGAEVLPSGDALLPKVLEQTRGEGAPVVVEATGNVKAMESTVDLVASGGRIVILGLLKKGTPVTFPGLDFTRKEMTVVGSRASVNCFPESLKLLASGAVHYPRVKSEFDMWDGPEIIKDLAQNPGKLHKAVLVRG